MTTMISLAEVAVPRGLVGGPFGSSLVGADYTEEGIPVLRGSNMAESGQVEGPFAFVSEEKFDDDLRRNVAVAGDLVFTQRGTLGQVAIVPAGEYDKYVVSQSQMRLRVDASRHDARYIYFACTTPAFHRQISDSAISTGVPHINLGILGELTVPDRVLEEQRGIAEVLGALDDKIAANREVVTIALDLGDSLVRAAVSHDEGVPLGDMVELVMGSSPPGTSYNEDGVGTVFYQGVRDFGVRSPEPRIWTTEPVRLAEQDDTMIAVRAPVGQVNLATQRTCIGRGLAAARSSTPLTTFHLLRTAKSAWQPHQGTGTVFASINAKDLRALPMPTITSAAIPGLELRLRALGDRAQSALAESDRLAATRDALLPLLMSGRVRVKDVEDEVGELV